MKRVETFKQFAKQLARQDQLSAAVATKNKKVKSGLKNDSRFKVQIKEPLTFARFVQPAQENLPEITFSNRNEADWDEIMDVIKQQPQEEQKDLQELMERPGIQPFFNLASVVNKLPTLQKLVDLGVKVADWEKKGFVDLAAGLNFENDVIPRILFLTDQGIRPNKLGHLFTENPELFQQDMDDLRVRINYLAHHKFSKDQIKSIVQLSDSKWLNYSTKQIDSSLGFLQKLFGLSNNQVTSVSATYPNLVIWEGNLN